jgi:hypothetical protein
VNKNAYVNNEYVKSFIKWVELKLDTPNSFTHSYKNKKTKTNWSCDCIYSAYKNYTWNNNTFEDNQKYLVQLSKELNDGIINFDNIKTKEICLKILEWGDVLRYNDNTISNYENDLVNTLVDIKNKLDPNIYDTDNKYNIKINSGFSKIYSLLINDYIIYDGRVGTALCYLVSLFCKENNLTNIPLELKFAFGEGRTNDNSRNPNNDKYKFSRLTQSNYLEKNMFGNWLLKEILKNTNSQFNKLNLSTQLRALESALFMIGYSIK